MKQIYVACAYTAHTRERTKLNIEVARHAGAMVFEAGASALMPTVNSAGMDILSTQDDYDFWIEATSRQLSDCDAVFLCQGWQKSKGVSLEVEQAKRMGIPVFTCIEALECWLKYEERI